MKTPLSLYIAFRFNRSNCGKLISSISMISIISIALSITVLIIGLSALNGFERELNNRVLAVIPHGEIEPVNSEFFDLLTVLKRIKQVPGIRSAAPYLNFNGIIESNNKLQAVQVKGIDPKIEMQLNILPNYVQDNYSWSLFKAGQRQIIIGKGVANSLKIEPGKWITMTIASKNLQGIKLSKPKQIHLQVVGILNLNGQLDHHLVLMPLSDAQQYLQENKNVCGIAIKVNNVFNANKLVDQAGRVTNTYVKIRSWIGTYGYIYNDIQMIRKIMYLSMMLIVGISCFGIISVLAMVVKEKNMDIAILRTLGARNKLIHFIFVWYGFLLGLAGSLIGIVMTLMTIINLPLIVRELEKFYGHKLLSSGIYFINFLPIELSWKDIVNTVIIVLLISVLTSWYPAQRASHINPIKILTGR
ncbi:lipoprotein-releasing ABC transporter permease subunit LolE [Sodalis sp. CWE]|uniref:lipoprotein-releasing ABC transporter permease subunit LolE n=1 Tax=Sodalis sp. CWE TaxID=2803816 RepID=UPI001C7DD040|nr:lipoprotein-releasing ABC transporter permease subunit LolE [Sodalis sp. CWE]MBX4181056.1 lipoprotein-releasing ABC transporter permease subunit LolE [Sodalis sp. CWE]